MTFVAFDFSLIFALIGVILLIIAFTKKDKKTRNDLLIGGVLLIAVYLFLSPLPRLAMRFAPGLR